MELIDRQASLNDIKEYFCSTCNNYNGIRCRACCVDDTIELIENTPTVDAVPVEPRNDNERCEYCRGASYTDKPFKVITQMNREVEVQFNYCPNCGAKIDGGAKDGKAD